MLSSEEIAQQQHLLMTHRRTLAIYLEQRAELGRAYSPPALINGIEETRSEIRRIKTRLSAAGVTVSDDPDDEDVPLPPIRPVAPPPQHGRRLRLVWWAIGGTLAIVLIVGVGWWAATSLPSNIASQEEPVATLQEETPTNLEATPTTETDVAALEGQLQEANIALSAVQVEQVREYMNRSQTGYKLLAEHALQIVGDQRFRDTIYLDELDTRYTALVGEARYAEFNEDKLKEAMVLAWNGHYPDNQVDAFEKMVEPRS